MESKLNTEPTLAFFDSVIQPTVIVVEKEEELSQKMKDLKKEYEYEQKYANKTPLSPAVFHFLTNNSFRDVHYRILFEKIGETGTWEGFYNVIKFLNNQK